jgi:hypothetical protein
MTFPVTLKQRDFLESLLFGRQIPEGMSVPDDLGALTSREASAMIGVLLAQPQKSISLGIPDGRYAIPSGKVNGRMAFRFYFVNTSKTTGGQYMLRLFGAPGDFRREKMPKALQVAVAGEISSDPGMFSLMFGREVGACGVCGSPLTDPESIALGIGPVCLQKMDW